MQVQTREGNVPKIQVALPRAHIHAKFQRKILAEMQTPIVFRVAKMNGVRILRDGDLADAICNVVIHAGWFKIPGKTEIRVKSMPGIGVDGQFSGAHLQLGARGLRSLKIDGLRSVAHGGGEAMTAGVAAAVPEKHYE